MNVTIIRYRDELREQVIDVWERSVRATHNFLEPTDIDFFKTLVEGIDFNTFEVYCAFDEKHTMAGILGVSEGKLEMLFLAPEAIGKGVGRKLLHFSINELGVTKVDVNEGNVQATAFYQKAGFQTYDRTPVDDHGKPYPILKMSLS